MFSIGGQNVNEAYEIDIDIYKGNSETNEVEESSVFDRFDVEEALEADEAHFDHMRIPPLPIKFIIIDCTPINFIDTVGIKSIKQVSDQERYFLS